MSGECFYDKHGAGECEKCVYCEINRKDVMPEPWHLGKNDRPKHIKRVLKVVGSSTTGKKFYEFRPVVEVQPFFELKMGLKWFDLLEVHHRDSERGKCNEYCLKMKNGRLFVEGYRGSHKYLL